MPPGRTGGTAGGVAGWWYKTLSLRPKIGVQVGENRELAVFEMDDKRGRSRFHLVFSACYAMS